MSTKRIGCVLAVAIAIATADTPEAATADVVRRCVDADGAVSWQSAPCGDGAREVAVRTIDAPAAHTSGVTRATPPAPRRRAIAVRRPTTDAARERCAAARREADARRERDWNRLGFRERSSLDADVARACAR